MPPPRLAFANPRRARPPRAAARAVSHIPIPQFRRLAVRTTSIPEEPLMSRHSRPVRSLVETLEIRRLLAADFTVAAMGDSQYIVESFPDIFRAQTQWAADNV